MARTRWEYTECNIYVRGKTNVYYYDNGYGFEGEILLDVLNQYGDKGWELVAVSGSSYTFKRELVD